MIAEPWVLSLAPELSKSVTSGKSLDFSISIWVTMEKNNRDKLLGRGEYVMGNCMESYRPGADS